MLKKILPPRILPLLALAPLMLALSACTDPIAAQQDTISQYPQIHLTSYWLQQHLVVTQPVTPRVGAGQLQVSFQVRNLTDDDLPLDYKYYFTDKNGVPVEHDTGWMSVTVPRKGIQPITFTSLTPMAADFRVEIRYEKYLD